MRRFGLGFAIMLAAVVLSAVLVTRLFISRHYPEAITACIGCIICVICIVRLTGKLVRVMSTFVSALEMNDTTLRFDFSLSGSELRRMGEAMNRIVELYRINTAQLETSKLYYDRILKVMTHEMRNSITPVIALASDMEKHWDRYSDGSRLEALALIRRQSEGIKRFLDSYYQLTHLPSPELVETEAVEFFGHVRDTVLFETRSRGLADDTCQFSVARGMTLNIDTGLMAQAMVNMLRNALDAVAYTEQPSVRVTVSMAAGHPYIMIEDNGCGIAPEVRDNIFQPFFTTKPGGCGVGLCLSRQIVRQHGGDIRILTTSGPGATFAITL